MPVIVGVVVIALTVILQTHDAGELAFDDDDGEDALLLLLY